MSECRLSGLYRRRDIIQVTRGFERHCPEGGQLDIINQKGEEKIDREGSNKADYTRGQG